MTKERVATKAGVKLTAFWEDGVADAEVDAAWASWLAANPEWAAVAE